MTAITINSALSSFPTIGYMPMPADFPYRKILQMGRPKHERYSDFGLRHPSMPCSRRAKIFAPFDALAGFSDRIEKKETLYETKKVLSDEEQATLDRKLNCLYRALREAKYKKSALPKVTVTFYSPCDDEENTAYGSAGTYHEITGIVTRIDLEIEKTITINEQVLAIENLMAIKGDYLTDTIEETTEREED